MNPPSESRRELDSAVVNIELTLTSIIQGVALFFLTDNARAAMSLRHWESFLYVVAGLCVIFIFWSRSIISHAYFDQNGLSSLGTTFFTSLAHLARRFFLAGSIILWRGFN